MEKSSIFIFICFAGSVGSVVLSNVSEIACESSNAANCERISKENPNFLFFELINFCCNTRLMCKSGVGAVKKLASVDCEHEFYAAEFQPYQNYQELKFPICCGKPFRLAMYKRIQARTFDTKEENTDMFPEDWSKEMKLPRSCTESSATCACELVANFVVPDLVDINNGRFLKFCFTGQPYRKYYEFMIEPNKMNRKRCFTTADCEDETNTFLCASTILSHYSEDDNEFHENALFCVKPAPVNPPKTLRISNHYEQCEDHSDCSVIGSDREYGICNSNNQLGLNLCEIRSSSGFVCQIGNPLSPLVHCESDNVCNKMKHDGKKAVCDEAYHFCCEVEDEKKLMEHKLFCPDRQTPLNDQRECVGPEKNVCPIFGAVCHQGHCCPGLIRNHRGIIMKVGRKPFVTSTPCETNKYQLKWVHSYCHNTDHVMIVAGSEFLLTDNQLIEGKNNHRCTINTNCKDGMVCLQLAGNGRCVPDPMKPVKRETETMVFMTVVAIGSTFFFFSWMVLLAVVYSIIRRISPLNAVIELLDFSHLLKT